VRGADLAEPGRDAGREADPRVVAAPSVRADARRGLPFVRGGAHEAAVVPRPFGAEDGDPDSVAVVSARATAPFGFVYGRGPIDDRVLLNAFGKIPEYSSVRTDRYLYVEYATGERELYDLVADPAQMRNLAGTKPAVERSLATQLARLRDCHAGACRGADAGTVTGL